MSDFSIIVTLSLLAGLVIGEAIFAVFYSTDVIEHCRQAFKSRRVRREPPPASTVDQWFDPYLRADQEVDPVLCPIRREPLVWPDDAVPIWEDQYAEPVAFVTRQGYMVTPQVAAPDDVWPNLERA